MSQSSPQLILLIRINHFFPSTLPIGCLYLYLAWAYSDLLICPIISFLLQERKMKFHLFIFLNVFLIYLTKLHTPSRVEGKYHFKDKMESAMPLALLHFNVSFRGGWVYDHIGGYLPTFFFPDRIFISQAAFSVHNLITTSHKFLWKCQVRVTRLMDLSSLIF